jgi:hypothetical protein
LSKGVPASPRRPFPRPALPVPGPESRVPSYSSLRQPSPCLRVPVSPRHLVRALPLPPSSGSTVRPPQTPRR